MLSNRLMIYNWQLPGWPKFTYDAHVLEPLQFQYIEQHGRLVGAMKMLQGNDLGDAMLLSMVQEAVFTSEIEGEYVHREDVRSSVLLLMGKAIAGRKVRDVRARGLAELLMQVRQRCYEPLSEQLLHEWHSRLMASYKGIRTGQWRLGAEPMVVISGKAGKEIVHFEAPPSSVVPNEMAKFLQWYNNEDPSSYSLLRAPLHSALAHLYFESIHPFEDGNGRMGRAISEKSLYQHSREAFIISLSKTISYNKQRYYEELKKAQRSLEITEWLIYFLELILSAQRESERLIRFIARSNNMLEMYRYQFNPRQLSVVERMLQEGPDGFEGGMSARKYIAITGTSKATATRDLQELAELGLFVPIGNGRSTVYELRFPYMY